MNTPLIPASIILSSLSLNSAKLTSLIYDISITETTLRTSLRKNILKSAVITKYNLNLWENEIVEIVV